MYICAKAPDKMKTTVSVFAAFFFISVLSVSCQGDPGDFNTTFSEIEKWMNDYPRKLFNGKSANEMYLSEFTKYFS